MIVFGVRFLLRASRVAKETPDLPTPCRACDLGQRYAVSALGNRVWKSRIPTHVGVMGIRAMGLPRRVETHAGPCSAPKYRWADSAYSGTTSSSISTAALPRTINTLYGHPV